MDVKQTIELTIRTAGLMMARFHMEEIAKLAMELDRFIESCE